MSSFIPVIGVLIAAAISPGPNNMIVMDAGARGGLAAAANAMLGVVAGSLVLLVLVWIGVDELTQMWPAFALTLSICGGAYLGWLGLALVMQRDAASAEPSRRALPATMPGVAVFQLLNPKAWLLVTTAAAAMPSSGGVITLGLLMALVTSICLALWALAGAASSRLLKQSRARRWFERAMGALLGISALAIVIDALGTWSRS